MRKVFLPLVILLVFTVFSCRGTPEPTPDDITEEYIELPVEEELPGEPEGELPEEELEDELPTEEEYPEEHLEEEFPYEEEDLLYVDDDTEDSDVEERLTSIEESLTVIEDQLALILEALANALAPPALPPEPVVEQVEETPAPEPEPEPELLIQEPEPVEEPVAVLPPPAPPPLPPPALLDPAEEEIPPAVEVPPVTPPTLPLPPPLAALRDEPVVPPLTAVVPQADEIVFSRIVRMTVGQILEVPFRGGGWVFLGELASRRGIALNARRNDPEGMTFIFNAQEPGTYILRFFRQDFIRDFTLTDHVQVIVGEAPTAVSGWFTPAIDRGRIVAEPRWPSALDEAAILRGELPRGDFPSLTPADPPVQEPPPTPPLEVDEAAALAQALALTPAELAPTPEWMPPETVEVYERIPPQELLQRARETFDGGNVAAAIALLDQYRGYFPHYTDELLWLYGQFFEANSPSRNILRALGYYRRLLQEFPQSPRANDARRRIAHLERFFINIQ